MPSKATDPSQKALKKLQRKGRNSAASKLAALILDDLCARPLREIVDPAEVAQQAMDTMAALAECDELESLLRQRSEVWLDHMAEEDGALGAWVPGEAAKRLAALVRDAETTDTERALELLDHEAMRGLVRRVLRETLSNFVRKMKSPVSDNRIISGVRRRARGLTRKPRELVGGMGGGLAGAVSDEMERQMQRRVGEFVDGAVGGVLRHIAGYVTEEGNQAQFGQMRAAITELVLETPSKDVARALSDADLDAVAAFAAAEIRGLAGSDLLRQRIEQIAQDELDGEPTLGEWLQRRNLDEAWRGIAEPWLGGRIRALATTDEFADWLTALLG
jgi:hypothetical protein